MAQNTSRLLTMGRFASMPHMVLFVGSLLLSGWQARTTAAVETHTELSMLAKSALHFERVKPVDDVDLSAYAGRWFQVCATHV